MRLPACTLALVQTCSLLFAAEGPREVLKADVQKEYPSLEELYKHLHTHPEVSHFENETARRIGEELRRAGCEVTQNFGEFGVVGVMKNGPGKTLLIRTDLDALPVKEQTGASYASKVTTKDFTGNDVSVMHACGHDIHMSSFIGAARLLNRHKDKWGGTILFIGQPAEERGPGARAMLDAGLYQKFGVPSYCVALHVNAQMPVGKVGVVEGYALANVDSVDVTVKGVGGHGAYPSSTKDPIVLAAQIVMDLQTIVSREVPFIDPAVVTVGSIHGGTKHNVIPDEVKLQLTVRSYSEETRKKVLDSIKRICRGDAIAAGIPEEKMPTVELKEDFTPSTYNDPELAKNWRSELEGWLGKDNVQSEKPVMGGEDFGLFGQTKEKVPICILWVGAVEPKKFEQFEDKKEQLPSLHSPFFLPQAEPAIKTGVTAYLAAALKLLAK